MKLGTVSVAFLAVIASGYGAATITASWCGRARNRRLIHEGL